MWKSWENHLSRVLTSHKWWLQPMNNRVGSSLHKFSPSDRLLPICSCEITWPRTRRWSLSVAKYLDQWWEFNGIHMNSPTSGDCGRVPYPNRQGTALRMASTKGSGDAVYLWWFMMMSSICFLRCKAVLSHGYVTSCRFLNDLHRSLWLFLTVCELEHGPGVDDWFSLATLNYQRANVFEWEYLSSRTKVDNNSLSYLRKTSQELEKITMGA